MILQYFPNGIVSDFIVLLISYAYVIVMILLPVTLKKKDKISKFTARKMVHLFAGLVVFIVPFFIFKLFATVIAGSLTAIVFFSEKGSKVKLLDDLYEAISEEQEEKLKRKFLQGPFNYCVSITVLVTIFAIIDYGNQMYLAIAGITIMIIADTLASVFGKKYGKHEINLSWTGTTRTLEGSLVFFVCSLIICLISYSLFGILLQGLQVPLTPIQVIVYSLITAVIGMIIELLSPSTWDDLIVPIGTTLLMYLLTFVLVI